jgi:formylglycine-generating enzyme required for sulfatase activity
MLAMITIQLSAQTVSNIKINQDQELGYYTITFDLSGKADEVYAIQAMPMKNGRDFANPRSLVGKGIATPCSPGKNMAIFWNPAIEGVDKDGWQFRINAKVSTINMVKVEGGSFMMGSNAGGSNVKPVHQVTVSSFHIGKYEVTQKEWQKVMGNNPSNWKGDYLPVEQVSWYDAVDYCNKRSLKEGLKTCYSGSGSNINCDWTANGYRLPTEAEWEYAARGGKQSKGYTYSGLNDIGAVAWYDVNSGSKTHTVGGKLPNELGIYDLSGNVWEWNWDIYGDYPGGAQNNPHGVISGSYRVRRGGSWYDDANYCTVSYRNYNVATSSSSNVGFRLVRATF